MNKDLIGFILVIIGLITFFGAIIYELFLISNILGFVSVGILLILIGFALIGFPLEELEENN